MESSNHILFLTSNNLASNPRLFKEVHTASGLGYHATIVEYRLGNWCDNRSNVLEQELKKFGVRTIRNDATKQNKILWIKWGLFEKFARIIYPLFKQSLLINSLASSRRSIQMLKPCGRLDKPNLIIAHNLEAAYPAFKLSQKWKIPFIFDVEDYHPGECIREDKINEQERRTFIMKTLLPKAAAITSASPLIGEYTLKLVGDHPNHRIIINSFPQNEFNLPIIYKSDTLRLVWFSQKISSGRGLEEFFKALELFFNFSSSKNKDSKHFTPFLLQNRLTPLIELTLIGDLDADFDAEILQQFSSKYMSNAFQTTNLFQLNIRPALPQPALHAELANYDVGMALEFISTDLNRELCLTNKIIAYAQAGLYILATDTPAQKQFMAEDPERGLVCNQTPSAIKEALEILISKKSSIRSSLTKRYKKGAVCAWEQESEKLISLWESIIKKK